MSLLVIIPATLAHWIYYPFSWVSMTYLLYFYLLLCSWAYWLSFLPRYPIGFITSLLGLSQLIYFTFTSYCAHESAGYHSYHIGVLSLLYLFWTFTTHLLYFYLFHFSFSLTFSYCWTFSFMGLFVKNRYQRIFLSHIHIPFILCHITTIMRLPSWPLVANYH